MVIAQKVIIQFWIPPSLAADLESIISKAREKKKARFRGRNLAESLDQLFIQSVQDCLPPQKSGGVNIV